MFNVILRLYELYELKRSIPRTVVKILLDVDSLDLDIKLTAAGHWAHNQSQKDFDRYSGIRCEGILVEKIHTEMPWQPSI